MIINVPKDTIFECPEGTHHAVLREVKEHTNNTKKGIEKKVRLIFETRVSRPDRKIVLVGKNYAPDLSPGSDLRNVLESWKGEDFFTTTGDQLDLKTLIGDEADIITIHHHSSKRVYEHPYVDLVGVYPPGTPTQSRKE